MIQQVSGSLVEKITSITTQAELLGEITKANILSTRDISKKNQVLINYLVNAIKYEPYTQSIAIATTDGNLISASNLSLLQPHSYLHSSKTLPEGAKYAIRIIDRSGETPLELWEYKDTDLNTLETESTSSISYDPRTEPWYYEVAAWPLAYWSDTLTNNLGEPAITVSVPIKDSLGKLLGVIGIALSLNELSNFISHQQLGVSGTAFVLNERGTILLPAFDILHASRIGPSLAEKAYKGYHKDSQQTFLFEKEQTKFLAHIVDFPLAPNAEWFIVTVVPFNDFFGIIIKTSNQTIYISIAILMLFGVIAYFSSKHISNPINKLASDVDKIQHFDFDEIPPIHTRITEIIHLDASISAMRKALRAFGHYVPKEIVQTLLEQAQEIKLGGDRREITILFSDIANFTTMTEALPIDKLTAYLSEYFATLAHVIGKSNGTIDKYIGDSIMAFWGAPQIVLDHTDKACLTALRCLKICEQHTNDAAFSWETRFGIHTGEVVVGNIGTLERMNYTAIGNAVNTAARIQSINKDYHTSILISENVHEKIGTRFLTRPIDIVNMKGKKNKITLFELMGSMEEDKGLMPTPEQIALCKSFINAFSFFHEGKLKEAKEQFLMLHQQFPNDKPTQLYLERLEVSTQIT